jgi:Domain of unknown function (DUF5666)
MKRTILTFCWGILACCYAHAQSKSAGVSGIVESKNGTELTLKMRTLTGERQITVRINDKTKYKHYAPDSVKFTDAGESTLAGIAAGELVCARGEKTGDGSMVAEEVVFGSFVTRAGTIVSIDPGIREIAVKELPDGKPLVIRVTADSRLKRMLDHAAMIAMMHGGGAAGDGSGPSAMGPPIISLNQMLERLPETKLEDLKAGDIVIVSSTRGAARDHVTAISVLANAGMLLHFMASREGADHGQPTAAEMTSGLDTLTEMGFGVTQ